MQSSQSPWQSRELLPPRTICLCTDTSAEPADFVGIIAEVIGGMCAEESAPSPQVDGWYHNSVAVNQTFLLQEPLA